MIKLLFPQRYEDALTVQVMGWFSYYHDDAQ